MKKTEKNIIDFGKDIEMLITERRKANKYEFDITQDDVFNKQSRIVLYKYIDGIKDKNFFHQFLRTWINMMEESHEVEDYIINGMDGVLGAYLLYMSTGIKIICLPD